MEIIMLLAVPTLTGLLAPIVLELIKKRIDTKNQERANKNETSNLNIQIGDDLRDELREENIELKKTNDALKGDLVTERHARAELEAKLNSVYALKKENQRLEFDLRLAMKELEFLREKYAEYVEIRDRINGAGNGNGNVN